MALLIARDYVNLSADELITTLGELYLKPIRFDLQFEDGVIINTHARELVYSHFFWRFHKNYPKLPLLSRHYVTEVLKGTLTSDTHRELLSILLKDVVHYYNILLPKEKEPILELIYDITNDINNDVPKYAEEYVTTIDALDFIEVVENPLIKETTDNLQPTPESINNLYKVILTTLDKDPMLSNNNIALAVRSKMVNANQVCQCVGVRGFTTEVDGEILRVPIMSNFVMGMTTPYDYAAESRSGAKSLYLAGDALQTSEYFARRLQLQTMVVQRIDYKDCGTTEYYNWFVKGPEYNENGVEIYPGALKQMVGKYYLDEDTNTLAEIKGNEKHLFNKVIKLRTVLTCKCKDPHAICHICFGALSKNISAYANVGHLCAATMTQQITQTLLSNKHLQKSAVSSSVLLGGIESRYLRVNKQTNTILFNERLKNSKVKVIIPRNEASGMIDIKNASIITDISGSRISGIKNIGIVIEDKKGIIEENLTIGHDKNKAIFSNELITYLKHNGWSVDDRNNFVINFDTWNFKQPVFRVKEKEYNFADHAKAIANLIESEKGQLKDRMKDGSPGFVLQELFDLVNSKLNVNLSALEVIVYANMVPNAFDYGLSRDSDSPIMNVASNIYSGRSLSAAYAYESQTATILDPRSFVKGDRPDSVMDVFITPREVVKTLFDNKY